MGCQHVAPHGGGNELCKGGSHVVDNCRGADNSVALGYGEQLHHGRIHSCPTGHRNCRCFDQNYSRAKPVVILTVKYLWSNEIRSVS